MSAAETDFIAFLACGACGGTEVVNAPVDLNRAACANCDQPTALVSHDETGVRVALPPGGVGLFLPAGGDEAEDVEVWGAPDEDLPRIYEEAGAFLAAFCDPDA